mgnify:CR=1 FL=1
MPAGEIIVYNKGLDIRFEQGKKTYRAVIAQLQRNNTAGRIKHAKFAPRTITQRVLAQPN